MDHTPLRLTSSRREGVSLTSPFARTFLSVLFYIFYRSLSCHVRSPDFLLASLVFFSLPCFRFFLRLSFCFPSSSLSFFGRLASSFSVSVSLSSHLSSRVPLCRSLAPLRRVESLSSSLFSISLLSSACLPFSSQTGRSRLTGLLMTYRIERETDPCCYAATAAEIHERSEREKERKSVVTTPKQTGGERPL